MAFNGYAVAYCVGGGLILFSGIKGDSLTDTAKAVLSGNLSLKNTEPINVVNGPSGTNNSSAPAVPGGAGAGSGNAIAAEAEKFIGHKYVFGGTSNPSTGWDCSSFVSYVLGQLGISIPGGTWAKATDNGKTHGPVAAQYLVWSGAKTVSKSSLQPGDLLCWPTHVGFVAGDGTHMISAYDTADGTLLTPINSGPTGEPGPVVRRINGVP
jgi:cell wall-associated NlpC family hydrolase